MVKGISYQPTITFNSAWEDKLLQNITEYRKSNPVFDTEKQRFIKEKLIDNVKINIEDLDEDLKRNGFYGMIFLPIS